MRIAIDVREACRANPAGKGMWTRRCTESLIASKEHEFILLSDCEVPASLQGDNVQIIVFPSGWRWHLAVRRSLKKDTPDVYLSTTSFIVPSLVGKSVPCAQVVHDLIAFLPDAHDRKAVLLEKIFLSRALKHVSRIFSISNATTQDLVKRFPFIPEEKISTIFAGPTLDETTPHQADDSTIISIGTLCPRKNQLRLIQAYALLSPALRDQYKLVLVGGRGWQDEEIVKLAQITDGVEWKGYISDKELDVMLASATVFALPSLYEGFGIPVLDAMQRGISVLTSPTGSLPEVAGDAAVYVDPMDTRSIADGLAKILTDSELRSSLRERGIVQSRHFSWERTAKLILNALLESRK